MRVGDVGFADLPPSSPLSFHSSIPKPLPKTRFPTCLLLPFWGLVTDCMRTEPARPRLQIHSHYSASWTSLMCTVLMSSTATALSVLRVTLLLAEQITGSRKMGMGSVVTRYTRHPSQEVPAALKRASHCHEPGVH